MGALPSWPPLNLPKVPFSNTITHVRTSFSRGYKYSVHYIYNILIFFYTLYIKYQFSSFQLLSRVWLFATPWIAACQASLPITNSQSSPKLMCIESMMPSSHLILCCPLLLPPIPPSIRVFSNESTHSNLLAQLTSEITITGRKGKVSKCTYFFFSPIKEHF